MQLQFLAPVELFFKQLKGYSFWPGRNQYFFIYAVFAAVWFVTSTLYQEWNVQPLWKVKGFEQMSKKWDRHVHDHAYV